MSAYYNEIDPHAAQWLRNLIAARNLPAGDVDERSIRDVKIEDLRGYTQCHFFAGLGGWPYALRLAGWPDDRPVWTGSCPCQPFSVIGQGAGFADERHLWPVWGGLIAERKPGVVFGEQVDGRDGRAWLDLVWSDMEALGYAFAPAVLPASGFGAPHGRHRLFFVGDSEYAGLEGHTGDVAGFLESGWQRAQARRPVTEASAAGGAWGGAAWVPCSDGYQRPFQPGAFPLADGVSSRVVLLRAYGNAIVAPVAEEFIRAYILERGI